MKNMWSKYIFMYESRSLTYLEIFTYSGLNNIDSILSDLFYYFEDRKNTDKEWSPELIFSCSKDIHSTLEEFLNKYDIKGISLPPLNTKRFFQIENINQLDDFTIKKQKYAHIIYKIIEATLTVTKKITLKILGELKHAKKFFRSEQIKYFPFDKEQGAFLRLLISVTKKEINDPSFEKEFQEIIKELNGIIEICKSNIEITKVKKEITDKISNLTNSTRTIKEQFNSGFVRDAKHALTGLAVEYYHLMAIECYKVLLPIHYERFNFENDKNVTFDFFYKSNEINPSDMIESEIVKDFIKFNRQSSLDINLTILAKNQPKKVGSKIDEL